MDQIPAEVLSGKGVGIVRGRKVQQLGTPCVAHCRSAQDDPDPPLGRLQSNAPTPLRPHSIHGFAPGVLLCVLHRLSLTRPVEVRCDRRSNLHGRRWCAWQESNLLPLAPQASAPPPYADSYSGGTLALPMTPPRGALLLRAKAPRKR